MPRVATTPEDVLLGEAVSGTRAERYADMVAIASVAVNRAMQLGVSVEEVMSVPSEFNAAGKAMPRGVEQHRDLARAALQEVMTKGPVMDATFYATPAAVDNLPSGLKAVTSTKGHAFFSDPQMRSINTTRGFITPTPVTFDQVAKTAPATALDAVNAMAETGRSSSTAAQRTGTAMSYASPEPRSAIESLRDLTNPTPATTSSPATSLGPTDTWDGGYTSPNGVLGDRVTSGFGLREGPVGSLGIGSSNHRGMDFSQAPGAGGAAMTAAPGVVSFAGPASGYGNMVEVSHPDGRTSRYGHLADINVMAGQQIGQGHPVGTIGRTGNSTGNHLHFEMLDEFGKQINPASVIDFDERNRVPTPEPAPRSAPAVAAPAVSPQAAYGQLASTMGQAGIRGIGTTQTPATPAAVASPTGQPAMAAISAALSAPSTDRMAPATLATAVSAPVSTAGPYASATAPAAVASLGTGKQDRLSAPAGFDAARFGGPVASPTSLAGLVSGPVSPMGSYAVAEDVRAPAAPSIAATTPSGALTSRDSTMRAGLNRTNTVGPIDMDLMAEVSRAPQPSFSAPAFSAPPTTVRDFAIAAPSMTARAPTAPMAMRTASLAAPAKSLSAPATSPAATTGFAPAGYAPDIDRSTKTGSIGLDAMFSQTPSSEAVSTGGGFYGGGRRGSEVSARSSSTAQGAGSALGRGLSNSPGPVGGFGGLGIGRGAVGAIGGSLLGGLVGGPIGSILGGLVGRSFMNGGFAGYPDAPAAPTGYTGSFGSNLSHDAMSDISGKAADAIADGKGGLY